MTTITKERKLLRQALDALETCSGAPCVDRTKKAIREYLAAQATAPAQPAWHDATDAALERAAEVCENTQQEYEKYTGATLPLNYACAEAIRALKGTS